ncbi:aminotransferase class V-fold PLP-dependent enzyme [Calditrichota bacterium LG25]
MSVYDSDAEKIRPLIIGCEQKVPTLSGEMKPYINFDNAASTPSFKPVLEAINQFMPWYSSIHRGAGFKSQLSTMVYDKTREIVLQYCKAEPQFHTVVYGKNTTELVNKVSKRLITADDEFVLTTRMEHHSNDLPWRYHQKALFVEVDEKGRLDLEDLRGKLKAYNGKIKLLAITGASNVTGYINPIYQAAQMAHEYGAQILVDAAQLAPHRPLDIKTQDDPQHIDFLVFSGHKIYAPFGQGALIADIAFLEQGMPDQVGGGVIDIVDNDYAYWTSPPDKDEAGTPNVVGALALAKALQVFQEIGLDVIVEHEKELTRYALQRMKEIPGITIYGSDDPQEVDDRLGVITFNLDDYYHAFVSAVLTYEHAIGVRNGCFCAHPYLKRLLKVTPEQNAAFEQRLKEGDHSDIPGAIRMSFGIYNTRQEIDQFIQALKDIKNNKIAGLYRQNKATGEFHPENYRFSFKGYFEL